jgi:hypothetical protein
MTLNDNSLRIKNLFLSIVFLFFLTAALLGAEEAEIKTESETEERPLLFFPLSLLYRAAQGDGVAFSPDWDASIPVDAFNIETFSSIILTIDNSNVDEQKDDTETGGAESSNEVVEYMLSKNSNGQLTQFPFIYNRALYQVDVEYSENEIKAFMVSAGGDTIYIEFLEHTFESPLLLNAGSAPQTARLEANGAYYFISFEYSKLEIIETFFSESGGALFLYVNTFIENNGQFSIVSCRTISGTPLPETETIFFYNNMGMISVISAGEAQFQADYNDKGVRYWSRRYPADADSARTENNGVETETRNLEIFEKIEKIEKIEIQYNENKLPVHAIIINGAEKDYIEYTYTFDSGGNWIERHELHRADTFNAGILLPVIEKIIKRSIIY